MSFQFSAETLLLEVQRRIELRIQQRIILENKIQDINDRLADGRLTTAGISNAFRERVNRQTELQDAIRDIAALENEKFLLQSEIDLREEQLQPIQVTQEPQKQINLKALALIGGGLLLFS